MKQLLLIGSLLIAFLGCTPEATPPAAKKSDSAADKASTAGMVVHEVKCGCSIKEIGKCGNYIRIDGKYVPLVHPSLGPMEFCDFKDAGAKIETKGAMKDGKFVAESWKLVQ